MTIRGPKVLTLSWQTTSTTVQTEKAATYESQGHRANGCTQTWRDRQGTTHRSKTQEPKPPPGAVGGREPWTAADQALGLSADESPSERVRGPVSGGPPLHAPLSLISRTSAGFSDCSNILASSRQEEGEGSCLGTHWSPLRLNKACPQVKLIAQPLPRGDPSEPEYLQGRETPISSQAQPSTWGEKNIQRKSALVIRCLLRMGKSHRFSGDLITGLQHFPCPTPPHLGTEGLCTAVPSAQGVKDKMREVFAEAGIAAWRGRANVQRCQGRGRCHTGNLKRLWPRCWGSNGGAMWSERRNPEKGPKKKKCWRGKSDFISSEI